MYERLFIYLVFHGRVILFQFDKDLEIQIKAYYRGLLCLIYFWIKFKAYNS